MTEVVIKAQNISKFYRLGKPQGDTFKEAVGLALKSLFNKKRQNNQGKSLWALKDVSFEIKKGEALGIVGRNGAGKSTLLKILAEITDPTEGTVEINGKVAAVLEIGMGFHPELSGTENVYLSGSILGMKTEEIRAVYEDIVNFCGLENFMDTPVKNYSSGMYMRLAFAVIAHVNADVFLFDEVLSVGDAAFRFKCQKKINELVNSGKTIILVSHNLNDVANICTRSLLLKNGKVKAYGQTFDILNDYIEESISESLTQKDVISYSDDTKFYDENDTKDKVWERYYGEDDTMQKLPLPIIEWSSELDTPGNEFFYIRKIQVKAINKNTDEKIVIDDDIEVSIDFFKRTSDVFIDMGIGLTDKSGVLVFISNTRDIVHPDSHKEIGHYCSKAIIPCNMLNSSVYTLSIFVAKNKIDNIMNLSYVLSFKIEFSDEELNSEWRKYYPPDPGILKPKLKWIVQKL
ncbi:MAG: ABC transporter ATP-binding protein [Bacteroidales bacterium]|nr:ABC transporter ATP-binding protein [Bacteroidales bacterium]